MSLSRFGWMVFFIVLMFLIAALTSWVMDLSFDSAVIRVLVGAVAGLEARRYAP